MKSSSNTNLLQQIASHGHHPYFDAKYLIVIVRLLTEHCCWIYLERRLGGPNVRLLVLLITSRL